MLFNSVEFFAFFAIVYTLYRVLPFRGQNAMLLLAGYIFYGWWDVRFLFLIAFSTVVDFNVGLMLGEGRVPRSKRITSSGFLLVAYLVFVCVDWSALHANPFRVRRLIFPLDVGDWLAFPFIALLAVVANLLHDRVARMPPEKRRTVMLITTVAVNVTFLAFFKYFNFFIGSAEVALRALGWDPELFHLNVLLPVGISFYTFQSLSYTIDAARGLVRPTRNFWEFALFVAYFPPMVAGPIERGRHLLPQLQKPRRIRLEQSTWGVVLILVGLFKKVAIADSLAPSVNAVYNHAGPVSSLDVIGATLLFAVQILCDFSGYSDIAIGVSKMLGIELITNFNLPYFSRNPSEFWRRWHISLSSWLRDYVYIPLGGNRKGEGRTYINLMTTMLLGGLWHGAAWNYVLWGGYQGVLLCVHRLFASDRRPRRELPSGAEAIEDHTLHADLNGPPRVPWWRQLTPTIRTPLSIAFFFAFVCYGWLLFRANSLAQIIAFSKTLVGLGEHDVPSILPRPVLPALIGVPLLFALQAIEYRDGRPDMLRHSPRPLQGVIYATMLLILTMGMSNAPVQFIYFQF